MKIKTLTNQLDAMEVILKQLKSDKEQVSEQKSVVALRQQMHAAIDKIKKAKAISPKEIKKIYEELYHACEKDLKKLKSILEHQKNKDEQDRLRKIQEEMQRVQRLKEEEDAKKLAEEEQRKQ